MKKILFAVIFLLGGTFALPTLASDVINDYKIEIDVNKDSSINVRELIKYDFGNAVDRHGIYRDIPFKYKNDSGNFKLRMSDFSVNDENGTAYNYEILNQGNEKRIKIGDADKFVSGVKNYIISYKVERAINYFSDHDELYWNAIGEDWDAIIQKSSVIINFPEAVEYNKDNFACFIGKNGSQESCLSIKGNFVTQDKISSISFVHDKLNLGEGFTVVAGMQKGLLIKNSLFQKLGWFLSDNGILLLPLLVFIMMYFLWRRLGRDAKGRGTIVPQYDVPDNLSPAQVGTLFDESADKKDISAEIINLAVQGFIKIHLIEEKILLFSGKDYLLERIDKEKDGLKNHEAKLLKALFAKKNREKTLLDLGEIFEKMKKENKKIDIGEMGSLFKGLNNFLEKFTYKDDIENVLSEEGKEFVKISSLDEDFYDDYEKIKKEIYSSLVDKGYFPKSPETTRNMYSFGGALFSFALIFVYVFIFSSSNLVLPFISFGLSFLVILAFARIMPAKTRKGSLAQEHILGFKDYLQVAEKDRIDFHNAPEKKPEQFEKFLPYAMALGVEKEWAKQFEGIYNQQPSWYVGGNSFSSLALANSLGSFQKQAVSTITSTASSGGSGLGGGGSVGGGFGGGGGGSW